jgi:hypothetical protein
VGWVGWRRGVGGCSTQQQPTVTQPTRPAAVCMSLTQAPLLVLLI